MTENPSLAVFPAGNGGERANQADSPASELGREGTGSGKMYIDTHAHIDDEQYENITVDEILNRAGSAGVGTVIAPAVDLKSALKLEEISSRFENVFFACGIHPHSAKDFTEPTFIELKNMLLRNTGAVAVGEVGIDYHYDFSPPSVQKHVFSRFVNLSAETGKPLIVHCRNAEEDVFQILAGAGKNVKGVIHCFSGNEEWARRFMELGFYLGFTGTVTFKNSFATRDVVRSIPIERILTETDSPYMTPAPHRKIKPNEPAYVTVIADKIAEIKNITPENAMKIFLNNAHELFSI